jgi:hypothetical protein
MAWENELPMEQKQRFINLAQSGRFTVSELSEEFAKKGSVPRIDAFLKI